jgi:hypothetical protein
MKLSRRENIIVVDSSGVESTCITSTGGGAFGDVTCNSLTSTGAVTSYGVPANYSEDGSTDYNLKAYGVSLLAYSTSATTRKFYTLDAPIKGISKRLVLASTVAPIGSSNATIVNTGSTNIEIMTYLSTAINVDYTNVALQTPLTIVDLIGVSTSKWALTNFQSASTNATYKGLAGLSSGLSTGIAST